MDVRAVPPGCFPEAPGTPETGRGTPAGLPEKQLNPRQALFPKEMAYAFELIYTFGTAGRRGRGSLGLSRARATQAPAPGALGLAAELAEDVCAWAVLQLNFELALVPTAASTSSGPGDRACEVQWLPGS